MNQPRPTSTRRVPSDGPADRAQVARGLAAVGLLIALVLAPPTALLLAVGNPMPDQAVINGRLTDAAVIGMLAAVVWVAWLQLMLAVVVETIAAVRRAPIPGRIPFTGPQQHLARRLVVAVSFLVAGGVAVSLPAAAATPASAATSAAAPVAPCPPVATDLNGGGASVDAPTPARPSAVTDRQIGPRTSAIPAQVRGPHARAAAAEGGGPWYTVRPPRGAHHDTLWGIAERHLGDGLRWKEIFELNRGRSQPDGRHLMTPSLIHPGWRLRLPADAVGLDHMSDPAPTPEAAQARRPRAAAGDQAAATANPPRAVEGGPHDLGAAAADAADASSAPQRGTSAADADDSDPTRLDGTAETDDNAGVPIGALTLGLSALACTGLIGELARRRRRAQRLRRPGQRLRHPARATARLERELHVANAELTVAALRSALHRLAEHCHRTARHLPDLQMIHLAPAGATLHFADDEPEAPPPFVNSGPRTWTLAAALASDVSVPTGELDGDEIEDPVDPYPALVALGVADAAMVLVNLEAAGTLRISGPPEKTEQVLCALALELGTSDLCGTAELGLAGCPPELLALLDPGRVRATESAIGRRWVEARQRDVDVLLDEADAPSMLSARGRQILADTWAPAILLESYSTTGDSPPSGAPGPHRGACLVTTQPADPADPAAPAGWVLVEETGAWSLHPLGITIEPQQFDPRCLAQLDDLVTVDVEAAPVLPPSVPEHTDTDPGTATHTVAGASGGPSSLGRVTVVGPVAQPTSADSRAHAVAADRSGGPGGDAERACGPRVLVLGPVEITGAEGEVASGRRRRTTEAIAYLALHPGVSQYQFDEALWPGVRVDRGTRNPLVSRARRWLGSAPDGQPYVAIVGDGQEYRLHPDVSCDWDDFRTRAARGLAAGAGGLHDLEAALTLVRGRPFLGVNPAAYGWAEADTQDMIGAIVDVAHALAERALAAADYRLARWAAARGIVAEPVAEILYQDAIRAAHAAGDEADAARLTQAIRREITDLDPEDDVAPDTVVAVGVRSAH